MMPHDLVLVRHGESEGNIANKMSRKGDNSAFTVEFRARHSSSWRLTDKGIWQAKSARDWLHANNLIRFGRRYVSEWIRAKETAAWLGLEGKWYKEFYLRERDRGSLDVMPEDEMQELYAEEMQRQEIDAFFWTPPGGESIAQLCLRIDRMLNTIHRECSNTKVIIVCHGEVMWAFRVRLERIYQRQYHVLDASKAPFDHIHNCQILHYTRVDPVSGKKHQHLNWMRSICPWDLTKSPNDWTEILRPKFTSEDLMNEVNLVTRMISE